MSEQLDLLTWEPPVATVLAFPQRRNIGRVRRVAAKTAKCKTHAGAQRCFDKELWNLCQSLKAAGLPHPIVDKQLEDFTNAVNAELWRLQYSGHQQPGGAA